MWGFVCGTMSNAKLLQWSVIGHYQMNVMWHSGHGFEMSIWYLSHMRAVSAQKSLSNCTFLPSVSLQSFASAPHYMQIRLSFCHCVRHFIHYFVLVQTRKTGNHPDMTEKLLNGIKSNKQNPLEGCELEMVRAATHYHTRPWQTLIRKRMLYRHCYIPSFPAQQAY